MTEPVHDFNQCLAILYEALKTPHGLVVATTDLEASRRHFAQARTADAALARLQIRTSRTNPYGELWIVQQEVE